MKALFTFILVLFLILVMVVGGVAAILYVSFFNIQPAEYSFLNDESEIVSIECAKFTFTSEGLVPDKVGVVFDKENFMKDLKAIDCHTGISISKFTDVINGKAMNGVVINYADGSFDFITPYICINSTYNPQGVVDLLNTKVYGFDEVKFAELVDKYGIEIPEELLENLEDIEDYLEEHPELIPQS